MLCDDVCILDISGLSDAGRGSCFSELAHPSSSTWSGRGRAGRWMRQVGVLPLFVGDVI